MTDGGSRPSGRIDSRNLVLRAADRALDPAVDLIGLAFARGLRVAGGLPAPTSMRPMTRRAAPFTRYRSPVSQIAASATDDNQE
jgi:hypothetical protein